jgi:copper homeostasis protein
MMLEIACFNASSAIAAAQAGSDRIELCADYAAGGLTPSFSTLQHVQRKITVPINVMIRPRGGDFNYTEKEFLAMKKDMEMLKPLTSGFVFGILDANRRIDNARNRKLVEIAAPLPCTFHRAIDEADDLDGAVETVIHCGFKSILTSGGAKNAHEGADRLCRLQSRFGAKVSLIVGGGLRSVNIEELKRRTGITWLHSAAITAPGEDVDYQEVMKMQQVLSTLE